MFSIGKGAQANIKFPDADLDDIHCTLHFDKDAIRIKDNNSAKGTFIRVSNKKPVTLEMDSNANIFRMGYSSYVRFELKQREMDL